ncbi:o-succinylbenzoate--CoA ligase [Frederiksenia canicola]|uniref:2-succinylbenzoyl-CoA synthetase n=1 Tax=Frederiksenia canicola TaxID=123824 RepID=A0AAE6X7Z1_9PAST|nr:o-succinylbenzoate--CoA ligase [Frederiksenia canicola]QIM65529.1 o-succinylbenzoate--CoA ligase [Frederiksenia canicola]RPE96021.1 2-succinylbenzoyl-CoA synthetase [Frederiksenia canicola]
MAEFALFPTAHWAEHSAQAIAVSWKKGDSALFSFLPAQISWQEWHTLVQQAVSFLQKNAIQAGDLVAYSGSHKLAGLLCYLAVLQLGAKILMLNPAMAESQRQAVLRENGVARLLTDDAFAKFSSELTACQHEILPLPVKCELKSSLPATFTLTSGSSGSPKAVVHSIQNHLDNAQSVCELMEFQQNHSWLLSLPLFHVSGQGIVWRWLLQGATLHLAENKADFWQTLAQVSHASLVPTQLQRYLARNDLVSSTSQKILLGGAFIPPELISAAQEKHIETFTGYGMTEMASTICAVQGELDNVGSPLKGRDVRIEQGEIWVRGAGLALGYWLNQQLVPLVNQCGWFATKDKGEWKHGKLVVCGRLDNQFISGGENIQPEQIERVLFQSGIVKQAFVVPIADKEFGQRPVAVVEFVEPFSQQAVSSLQNFAIQHLEKFKLPVAYFPLEITAQGGVKISRRQLQQEIAQKRELYNV